LGQRPIFAIVEATGLIASEMPRGGFGGQPTITPQSVRRLFKRLRDDSRFAGVVLAIDSPGGSALASDLIWREIRLLAQAKPVIALMRSVAASGGYYMAAAAHEIVASPVTLTGSIGVIAGKLSASGLLERANIHGETLSTSPWATLDSPRSPFTADQISALRRTIRESYSRFVGRVALGRGLHRSRVHLLGRGRVYTGAQAAQVGLVDSLGSMDESLSRLEERTGLPLSRAHIMYMSLHRPSWRSLFTGGSQMVMPWPLGNFTRSLLQATSIAHLLQRETVLALCDVVLPGFSQDE
jgi:protease-4